MRTLTSIIIVLVTHCAQAAIAQPHMIDLTRVEAHSMWDWNGDGYLDSMIVVGVPEERRADVLLFQFDPEVGEQVFEFRVRHALPGYFSSFNPDAMRVFNPWPSYFLDQSPSGDTASIRMRSFHEDNVGDMTVNLSIQDGAIYVTLAELRGQPRSIENLLCRIDYGGRTGWISGLTYPENPSEDGVALDITLEDVPPPPLFKEWSFDVFADRCGWEEGGSWINETDQDLTILPGSEKIDGAKLLAFHHTGNDWPPDYTEYNIDGLSDALALVTSEQEGFADLVLLLSDYENAGALSVAEVASEIIMVDTAGIAESAASLLITADEKIGIPNVVWTERSNDHNTSITLKLGHPGAGGLWLGDVEVYTHVDENGEPTSRLNCAWSAYKDNSINMPYDNSHNMHWEIYHDEEIINIPTQFVLNVNGVLPARDWHISMVPGACYDR